MSKLSIKSGPLACLLIFFLTFSVEGHSNRNQTTDANNLRYSVAKQLVNPSINQREALAYSDTLAPNVEHENRISSLVEYFAEQDLPIQQLIQDSRFEIYEEIADKFRYSAEKKAMGLDEYKKILRFEDKSNRIIEFIDTHADQLAKAEETYGISRYVISAILGIESNFGRVTGSYNPFNTYVSMYAVGYRQEFARAQLEELLIWADRNGVDIFELKSSYAGAMAYAQFIPYSLNKWFVGDDIFDMNNNIMSVANYLAYFKERTGSVEKAVFRYNPSSLYTGLVMDLAQAAEETFSTAS